MPTYKSDVDPYWKQRKLSALSESLAALAAARKQKKDRRENEEKELLGEAGYLAGKVSADDPFLLQIRDKLSPEGKATFDAMIRASPSVKIWENEQRDREADAALEAMKSEGMLAAMEAIRSFSEENPGATIQQRIRGGIETLPIQTRVALGQAPIQREFDPTKDIPTGGGQRAFYLSETGELPGETPDFLKALRYSLRLEQTPQQTASLEERRLAREQRKDAAERTAGIQSTQAKTAAQREARLAKGSGTEDSGGPKPEDRKTFVQRRRDEILDENKASRTNTESHQEKPPLLSRAAANRQAVREWTDPRERFIQQYMFLWGVEREVAERKWDSRKREK